MLVANNIILIVKLAKIVSALFTRMAKTSSLEAELGISPLLIHWRQSRLIEGSEDIKIKMYDFLH